MFRACVGSLVYPQTTPANMPCYDASALGVGHLRTSGSRYARRMRVGPAHRREPVANVLRGRGVEDVEGQADEVDAAQDGAAQHEVARFQHAGHGRGVVVVLAGGGVSKTSMGEGLKSSGSMREPHDVRA